VEINSQLERLAGNQPLSRYVKAVLLNGATAQRPDSGRTQTDHAILATVLAALGKTQLGPSLERLSRAAENGNLHVDAQTIERLHEAFNQVALIYYGLLTGLGKRPDKPHLWRKPVSYPFREAAP